MKAIYVHGLGSGAASTTIDIVREVFSDYEWTAVEVNEDPVDSINTINQAIAELHPAFLMGTSLGGLYLMYADMNSCEEDAIRLLFNPACDIARIIREAIGFGSKEYFVSRQDGVQEYELNEAVCARLSTSLPVTSRRLVNATTMRCSRFTTSSSGRMACAVIRLSAMMPGTVS